MDSGYPEISYSQLLPMPNLRACEAHPPPAGVISENIADRLSRESWGGDPRFGPAKD